MVRSRGIKARLVGAFGSLLLVVGTAAYFAMTGLGELHDLLHDVKHREAGVRAALELASAIRDQYAHQAHTIILGNRSHMGFYDEARARVLARTEAVRPFIETGGERTALADIERASRELDDIFRYRIVPAVLASDEAEIQREHARAESIVSLIQARADGIATSLEATMAAFEAHASLIEHKAIRWALVWFVLAIGLAAGLGVYISNSIARPVAKLKAGAERVAAGDLETRIALDTTDELGQLAAQFDVMTKTLAEHQRHLVESEKLAGIGRLAAGVAHEINNPLAVILGYARLMQRGPGGEHRDDAKLIEEEAVRCQEIVQDLLDLARPAKVEAHPVALESVCAEAVERLTDAKKLPTPHVTIAGSATVLGSPPKLRQILMNLIQNAAEAAGPKGSVRAEVRRVNGRAEVSVIDTGPGLTDDQRARLFEPFFTTKPKGTGLGLAVSRAIANAHGGDIEASAGTSGGAVFTLTLPSTEERSTP
ncbi:ATP-binding protein [Myxococcota bacterium]|nr:ATP-binding protein [Myxococcota bacterium]